MREQQLRQLALLRERVLSGVPGVHGLQWDLRGREWQQRPVVRHEQVLLQWDVHLLHGRRFLQHRQRVREGNDLVFHGHFRVCEVWQSAPRHPLWNRPDVHGDHAKAGRCLQFVRHVCHG